MKNIFLVGLFIFFGALVVMVIASGDVFADEIMLNNGDKVSGEIIGETANSIIVSTKAMGQVEIAKRYIKPKEQNVRAGANEARGKVTWKRQIAAGFNATSGNTEERQISSGIEVGRSRYHVDEWALKAGAYYSSSEEKMNAQKWNVLGRYAFSFGKFI